jgi:hypothetical protein
MQLSLRWVSPLRSERYQEYKDAAFMSALGLSRHVGDLSRFWPNGGPRWDGLALLIGGSKDVLLVEAKSHVSEMLAGTCRAGAAFSVAQIDAALSRTKDWLQVPQGADWKGQFYQLANRIAHLYFFRELLRIGAWLVSVYFTDDPHSPTSRATWEAAIPEVKRCMGIRSIPFYADVLLPALT